MKMSMLILTEIGRMKVSQLIEWLSLQDKDDDVTFYYLKNDTLTNCQLETIIAVSYTHLTLPTNREV